MGYRDIGIRALIGKTLKRCENPNDEEIIFETTDNEVFVMNHIQDCCESVRVEDICGDLQDLVGSPILQATEDCSVGEDKPSDYAESWTWTFYNIATVKGHVTIRWLGESNGYYSESVDFVKIS